VNRLFFSLIFLFSLSIISCKKKCESQIATCAETPPNELCQAVFSRWFYNKDKNKCELITYSGCSQKGFSTEKECEECQCK
jgi:hypothetical protein